MNPLLLRTIALLVHAALSLLIANWLLNFDITSRWLYFAGFIIVLLILLYFFVRHIISFLYFIKTNQK